MREMIFYGFWMFKDTGGIRYINANVFEVKLV